MQAIFREEFSVRMAGVAATGKATVDKVRSLHPDVVLMDIAYSDSSGAEIVRRIRQRNSSVLILILTLSDAVGQIADCIEAGASGYVSCDVSSATLVSVMQKQVNRNKPAARSRRSEPRAGLSSAPAVPLNRATS
jgi:DNA-binding NarL/FixJ family response regulator